MRNFKLAPIPLALATALAFLPITHADVPSKGDLEIYTPADDEQNMNVFFMLEGSDFMNYSDLQWQHPIDAEIIDPTAYKSETRPEYNRWYYYNSFTESKLKDLFTGKERDADAGTPTRLTRMKDAIFYLMDTEGAVPEYFRIGVGRYSGGVTVLGDNTNIGDSLTSNIAIPSKRIGPVTDYVFAGEDEDFGKNDYIYEYYIVDNNYNNTEPDYIRFKNTRGFTFKKDGKLLKGQDRIDAAEAKREELKAQGKKLIESRRYKLVPTNVNMTCDINHESDDDYFRLKSSDVCSMVESHRYKIKKYVANMCDRDAARFCTGQAPMASAYAEAGAYIMGTKTAEFSRNDDIEDKYKETAHLFAYHRALRRSKDGKNKWQYCPEQFREVTIYPNTSQGTVKRAECADGNWLDIDSDNVVDYFWARETATKEDIDKANFIDDWTCFYNGTPDKKKKSEQCKEIRQNKRKLQIPLHWGNHATRGSTTKLEVTCPHNVNVDHTDNPKCSKPGGYGIKGVSPITNEDTRFDFHKDKVQTIKKTDGEYATDLSNKGKTVTDEAMTKHHLHTAGTNDDKWFYYLDNTIKPETSLQPIFRQRVFRNKGNRWQYCPSESHILVNYIYSSYRHTCDDKDWIDVNENNADKYKIDWNKKNVLGIEINQPHGIHGEHIDKFTKQPIRYWYDPIRSPKDGWSYWYDSLHKEAAPPLPKTLNVGYTTSGMRNSSPEVRVDSMTYKYQHPHRSQCSVYDTQLVGGQTVVNKGRKRKVENLILFFTAGWPQSAALAPINEMNMSLTPVTINARRPVGGYMSYASCNTSGLKGGILPVNNHWGCMADYAKRLRDPAKNPAHTEIRTGVFLFASRLEERPLKDPKLDSDGLPIYDCDTLKHESQRNACRLGSYHEDYGKGGYFVSVADKKDEKGTITKRKAKESYETLAKAFNVMTKKFNNDGVMQATNMVIAPTDSFAPDSLLSHGYLPLMAPTPETKTALWSGNVRKYLQIKDGSGYVDQDGHSPYATGSAASILRGTTRDYWSSQPTAYDSLKQGGGAYENVLKDLTAKTVAPRRVYISNIKNKTNNELLQVKADNITVVNDATGTYGKILPDNHTNTLRRLLLNYMGYGISNYTSSTSLADIQATYDKNNKSLGGVYHSTPIAITSELQLGNASKKDAWGENQNKDKFYPSKQYIVFGAMDNALHVVDNATGEEYMSYIPKEVLATNYQYRGLTPEMVVAPGQKPPIFGVDGPWSSYVTYKPNGKTEMKAKELYIYGGARLGAKAYYGLDLTKIGDDDFTPKQLFTITPETRYVGGKLSNEPSSLTNGQVFNRLGYSWAKPIVAKIKWQGESKDVVILTGGYDTTFDKKDEEFTADVPETKGNAIYIVDARTGAPLIVASNTADNVGIPSASNSDNTLVNNPFVSSAKKYNGEDEVIPVLNSHLKYSVVSTVKTLDRDSDELVDNIYFTDLNGQVFRLDIDNQASSTKSFRGGKTNPAVRLVRLADFKQNGQKIGPRFYESPIVTIHQNDNKQRFATVSVASGDRSNPLDADNTTENRVYAIYDKDVGRVGFFNTALDKAKGNTVNINFTDLVDKPKLTSDSNYTKRGWTYPLTRFNVVEADGGQQNGQITYSSTERDYETYGTPSDRKYPVKALGPMSAVGNRLFISAYNPLDGLSDQCSTEAKGSAEAYQFCLPYGICQNSGSQIQRVRLGKGIQGIVFGGVGENQTDRQLMTQGDYAGQKGVTDPMLAASTGASHPLETGGTKVPDFKSSFVFKPVLRPVGWYDLQSQNVETPAPTNNTTVVTP